MLTYKQEWLIDEYMEKILNLRSHITPSCHGETDEEKRDNALFIIGFIFKNVLGYKTYEEALEHQEMYENLGLYSTFHRDIYIDAFEESGRTYIRGIDNILYIIYHNINICSLDGKIEIYEYLSKNAKSRRTQGKARKQLSNLEGLRKLLIENQIAGNIEN